MATPDHRGRRVGGFELLEPLASGGFATVYRARQLRLDRDVAVKVLDPMLARDPDIAARFEREGRAAASLDHPNVVTVYEAGEDDGLVYLAMRLVEGETLDELLLRRGPLTVPEAASLIAPVAAALDHAHERGLIHRDVKPSNIFVDGDRVWLGDFGIAATADQVGHYTTGALGTAHYMAPEQANQGGLDGRADLYALGCVVYRCLTGRPPYDRGELVATLVAHVNEPVPTTGQPRLDGFLARALAKAPEDRFSRGAELVASLRSVGPIDPVGGGATGAGATAGRRSRPAPPTEARDAVPPGPSDAPTISPSATARGGGPLPPPPAAQPVRPARSRRRRGLWLGAALVALAAVILGGWLLLGGDGGGGTVDAAVGDPVAVGDNPRAVATGDGSVFVANVDSQTLSEVPTDGGDLGAPAPLQATPVDVAVDEAGRLAWVSTTSPDRTVLRLDLDGLMIAPVALGFGAAGVTADAEGAWVADTDGQRVVRLDPSGAEVGEVVIAGPPTDLVLAAGSLWVAAGNAVVRVDPDALAVTGTLDVGGNADEITASEDAVFVTDRGAATLTRFDTGDPSSPTTVDVAAEPSSPAVGAGGVWIVSPSTGRAHRYDPETMAPTRDVAVGGVLGGLAVDGDDVWVTRAEAGEVVRVTADP